MGGRTALTSNSFGTIGWGDNFKEHGRSRLANGEDECGNPEAQAGSRDALSSDRSTQLKTRHSTTNTIVRPSKGGSSRFQR